MLRFGVHRPLEDAADRMIRDSLAGVHSHTAKRDVLTPWKENQRRRREVLVPSGTPDAALRRGNFHRAEGAAHLNSRQGIVGSQRIPSSLARFVAEHRVDREIEDSSHG